MRLAFFFYFLTFVVLSANAAPDTSIKPSPVLTREAPPSPAKPVEIETTQTTQPAPVYSLTQKWRASNGSTNIGLGSAIGPFNKDKETESVTTFQLQRSQYNLDETAQEYGLTLMSDGLLGLDAGFKKFCCFTNPVSHLSPFYKIGAAGIFEPKDELGNFIDYQRYFFQVSVGFENLWVPRQIWRIEAGVRSGYPGTHLFAQLFYAFPD